MATVRVLPDGGRWKVTKNGRTVSSNHRKKSAAKREARRRANDGDHLYTHRQNGTVQNEVTVGGGGDY